MNAEHLAAAAVPRAGVTHCSACLEAGGFAGRVKTSVVPTLQKDNPSSCSVLLFSLLCLLLLHCKAEWGAGSAEHLLEVLFATEAFPHGSSRFISKSL